MEIDERILYVAQQTVVLRPPHQLLETFGPTVVNYHLLTEPAYREFTRGKEETVVREGRISWQSPRILTPRYMLSVEGFSDEGRRYFEMLAGQDPNLPGILYKCERHTESERLQIVASPLPQVADNIKNELDRSGGSRNTIILGPDDGLWDISLIEFIARMNGVSFLYQNVPEFGRRGLLRVDEQGVLSAANYEIETLFQRVRKGEMPPQQLKEELDRWELFDEYKDRFLDLFRRRQ